MSLSRMVKRATQVRGSGLATECGDRRHTWEEFGTRIARLAAGLRGLGLRAGDRVAMLALNSDRYFEYLFAVPWAGGVLVPINTRLAPPEIAYSLTDSGTSILLVDDHFTAMLPRFRDAAPSVKTLIHVGDGPAPSGSISLEALIDANAPAPDAGRAGDDLAALFYTGGTTGRSKGVMLSHRNLIANALQMLTGVELRPGEKILHAAPMFHLADGAMSIVSATAAVTSCFIPSFTPEATLAAIERYGVTRTVLVPTMINLLLLHADLKRRNLSSLRWLLYGGSPMPEAVLRHAIALLPNVRFVQAYGQTEAAPVLTLLLPEYHVLDGPQAGKLTSAGQAVPGVQVAILDDEDRELTRGAVGQICARGDNVMQGYWKMSDLSGQTLRGGWLHTGDAGYMDEDGFVFVVDRVKDMIVTGGENVYSAEVENALYQHSAIAECAVIGVPHDTWGEQVHAIVRLKPGESVDADELIAHCKTVIANYKCPRSIEFRPDPLPVSGAGKILKAELRRPFWSGRTRSVA